MNNISCAKLVECNPDVMNLLNEIIDKYPNAISFASGRPNEQFYDVGEWGEYANKFSEYFSTQENIPLAKAKSLLGQYGKTSGIINGLLAEMLLNDEGLCVDPGDILVTSGAQEAMLLCLLALCQKPEDCILATDPVYIGISGAARISQTDIYGIENDDHGPSISHINNSLETLSAQNKNVKALYLVSNYDSTTGNSVSNERRCEIVELCRQKGILIIEDNPYGLFTYDGDKSPNIKMLDEEGSEENIVIYIGSFSKLIGPGLRIGFAVLPKNKNMSSSFSQIKSFTTLNTSQFSQAIAGGYLLENDRSIDKALVPAISFYRNNRDILIENIEKYFCDMSDYIQWSVPKGGFFMTVRLPFEFSTREMTECAENYQVILIPVSCFSGDSKWKNYARLSFSYVAPENIESGVKKLKEFVLSKIKVLNKNAR